MANKRSKLDISSIHRQLKNHDAVLYNGIKNFENKQSLVCFVRILACSGGYRNSFSDAWCETEIDYTKCVLYKHLFDIGILEKFLDTGVLPNSLNENQKYIVLLALQTLALFMDDYEETNKIIQKYRKTSLKEVYWTGIFGTHIIKKLATSKNMKVSECGYENCGAEQCHCGCGEQLVYGDTSMGHREVWHGSVDILLQSAAVEVTTEEIEDLEDFEMKIDDLEKQPFPQAIVTSCSMRGPTPLITVSKTNVKIFLYDYDSDLLFESEEFFFDMKLEISTILGLWLAINNQAFGLPINPAFIEAGCRSGFKTLMQEANKLDVYENHTHLYGCKNVCNIGLPIHEVFSRTKRGNIQIILPK
ncbi:uncharacterized protein LOC123531227 [Mercenaria mercenaria]|uniref:uncharacterized protein LOC123531227 n=1 Tax=Mercenaria mercenaria TaxID=6596 RepID=UPI00234F687F|nr:uncharacterized protein LOC123531227 [Mercenaria mercenaria]